MLYRVAQRFCSFRFWMFIDEVYDVYFHVGAATVVGCIVMICNVGVVYLFVYVVNVFLYAVFDFSFGLFYILCSAFGAFDTIYHI